MRSTTQQSNQSATNGSVLTPRGDLWQIPRLCSILCSLALFALTNVVSAKQIDVPVAEYDIQCDELFSCPESLLPRVGFWIEVFSRWETNTAILHDKDNPQRAFSTLVRKQGCRHSRNGDSLDRERKRLKRSLRSLASKLDKGANLSNSAAKLYQSFDGASAAEVRASANRLRCQSGNRDRMFEALQHFQQYRSTILDALESENLTPELQYLPFVESAFNPEALSHVGAAGMWQIMPDTGRTLGLVVNNTVDQRYDPTLASYAAARYFRNSVDKLSEVAFVNGFSVAAKELNPFVITSYNYGVRGMERAVRQVGLDYERLLKEYKSPNFQTAVKNFYASFLAARHVAKNTDAFFGPIPTNRTGRIHSFNTVSLKRATSIKRLSKGLAVDKDILKKLNPALKKVVWRDKALVPKSYQLRVPHRELGWANEFAAIDRLAREIERPGYLWHRVKSGQTACGIADRYGASCSALRRLNNLNRRATIYAGKRLKVPTANGGISVASSASSSDVASASNGANSNQIYRVQKGESACLIANRHGMKCGAFLAINGLTKKSVLRIGQRVSVSTVNAWHTVQRGQTACNIARSYGVACNVLLDANRLNRRSTIFVGQKLRIPHNS